MPYHKKRVLSYTIVILCFLTAYTCRLIHTNNSLIQALVDQSRTSIYLGMYCAWVIYLNKHVVYKRMRQCLTVIGCLMVFWFFLRTVKYHIFQDPLSTHICWYLYYFPMILIPTLGLNASFLLEEEHDKVKKRSIFLLFSAMLLIISVFTNDLHQQVFHFYLNPPYSDKNYSYGFLFFVIQGWIIFCLIAMDIILIHKSKISGKKRFWLPVIPGIILLAWNIANILRVPMISTIAGDLTAICCLCIAAIFQSCILCGLIPTNSRYFELFQSNGSLDAEITDNTFHRYYYSGNFPKLTEELRECVIANSSIQENGVLIKHIPVKGGHLFWTEDISVLLDQYQDIEENQYEDTERHAEELGISIQIQGSYPDTPAYRCLTDRAIRECVTNCARHAHGNTVFVIMKRKRNEYQIQITNDGELPSKDAKEGGGLSALRKAVEAEGGSMNTFFEPAFYLLLNLPLFDEEY